MPKANKNLAQVLRTERAVAGLDTALRLQGESSFRRSNITWKDVFYKRDTDVVVIRCSLGSPIDVGTSYFKPSTGSLDQELILRRIGWSDYWLLKTTHRHAHKKRAARALVATGLIEDCGPILTEKFKGKKIRLYG